MEERSNIDCLCLTGLFAALAGCLVAASGSACAVVATAPSTRESAPTESLARAADAVLAREILVRQTSVEFDTAVLALGEAPLDEKVCAHLLPLSTTQIDRDARSLMAHLVASRCERISGNVTAAEEFAARIPGLMHSMRQPPGRYYDDHVVAVSSLVDAIAWLSFNDLDSVAEMYEASGGGRRLHLLVVARARAGDRIQRIRFDLSDYAKRFIAAISVVLPDDQKTVGEDMPGAMALNVFGRMKSAPTGALVGLAEFNRIWQLHPAETASLLRKAAAVGEPHAHFALARFLVSLDNGEPDFARAREHLADAVAAGLPDAHLLLAAMYQGGFGVAKNKRLYAAHMKAAVRGLGEARAHFEYAIVLGRHDSHVTIPDQAVSWLRRSAKAGFAPAQVRLADVCMLGTDGSKVDLACALRSYAHAARQGSAGASCALGILHERGRGVPVDIVRAKTLYEAALSGGDITCAVNLGNLYDAGRGVARDDVRAAGLYMQGADWGESVAQNNLAVEYANGTGVPADEALAFKWFRRAAKNGYLPAVNSMAFRYLSGHGVSKDEAAAVYWYRYAAMKGDPVAQYQFGILLMQGRSIAKDQVAAVEWYRKAAAQENTDAMDSIGLAYENGEGVAADLVEASRWYLMSAQAGNADGQSHLGNLLLRADTSLRNPAEARAWLELAASQANPAAMNSLGWMYENGTDGPVDLPLAVKWFTQCADKGDVDCLNNLARQYWNGTGVDRDLARARGLFERAATGGSAHAYCNLGEMVMDGEAGEADANKALDLWEKSADLGNVLCREKMAVELMTGTHRPLDYDRAMDYLRLADAEGSATAKWRIAKLQMAFGYAHRDPERGRAMLEEVAEGGMVDAQFDLGVAHYTGRFGARDFAQAHKWYERAASHGHAEAAAELGMLHVYGQGVERDFSEAIRRLESVIGVLPDREFQVELARLYVHAGKIPAALALLAPDIEHEYGLGRYVYARICLEHPGCTITREQARTHWAALRKFDLPKRRTIAWFLAIYPTSDTADGRFAVGLLEKDAAGPDVEWNTLQALAAAYARSGDFNRAAAAQQRAIIALTANSKEGTPELIGASKAMLTAFQNRMPWDQPF